MICGGNKTRGAAHAEFVLDISAKQAQKLYDDALRAAFEVHQLGHLADDGAVTRAVEEVAARADSFIEVITELESREAKA